jgi:hypothetical protein
MQVIKVMQVMLVMHVINIVFSKAKQIERYYTACLGSQEVSQTGQVNQVNAYIIHIMNRI